MEHTKAPWVISDDGESVFATDSFGERLVIARAMHGNEADMKLIAAAPEMLAALKQAKTWLEGWASAEVQLAYINSVIGWATTE